MNVPNTTFLKHKRIQARIEFNFPHEIAEAMFEFVLPDNFKINLTKIQICYYWKISEFIYFQKLYF